MSQALFDLSGRTALVTGSSRGLGRALAEGLAKAGAGLIVNGVDPGRVEAVVAELRARGYQADGAAFDVTDETQIVDAFARFDAEEIEIGILVNNTGIQVRKPLVEMTLPVNTMVTKELQLRGTFRFDPEFELALRLMGEGLIDVKPLITASLPFASAVEAFELASDRSKSMKVQLTF